MCAQLRTTCCGDSVVDLDQPIEVKKRYNAEIELRSKDAIENLEMLCPGTLLNNCSYTLWHERYVVRQETRGRVNPLESSTMVG